MKPSLAFVAILSTGFSAAITVASVMAVQEAPLVQPTDAYTRSSPTAQAVGSVEADTKSPRARKAGPTPSPGSEAVFPEHLRQFDMVCDTHSRVSGIPAPPDRPSSPVLTADPWDDHWRESIDLDRMLRCLPDCWKGGIEIAADSEHIIFDDDPDEPGRVRRSDGAYYDRLDHGGRIVTTTGTCRPAPYTAF